MTAGNSSGINDGAAALLLCTAEVAAQERLEAVGARGHVGRGGRRPASWASARSPPSQKALARADLTIDDLDLVEINEAFASQSIACMRDLKLDPAQDQRQRRRHRPRPSPGLQRRAPRRRRSCTSCAGAAGRYGARDDVHRRRTRHRDDLRAHGVTSFYDDHDRTFAPRVRSCSSGHVARRKRRRTLPRSQSGDRRAPCGRRRSRP